MQAKKQQLELDMEQQIGSKSGKEYVKAVYCHPASLTYLQILKSRYYFANKGPSSQGYGFSRGHVWM